MLVLEHCLSKRMVTKAEGIYIQCAHVRPYVIQLQAALVSIAQLTRAFTKFNTKLY